MAFSYWAHTVNFCESFRRISNVWENAQTQKLENCLLSLFAITSQFLDFFSFLIYFFIA